CTRAYYYYGSSYPNCAWFAYW
nr:immunoglobulin heavy chain junction region [Mus musculus]